MTRAGHRTDLPRSPRAATAGPGGQGHHAAPRGALLCLLGAGLWAGAGAAHAGVSWQMDRQRGAEITTAAVYVEGDDLRMESGDRQAGSPVVLYNAVTKKMTVLRPEQRSYMEMGEADMKRMRAQMSGQMEAARAQMEARMKGMPPEQRKMVEQMMAQSGMAPGGASAAPAPEKEPEWTFQATGQKKTISGFPCEVYRVLEGGALKEEDCLSPWSKGVVTKDDILVLLRFAESMTALMSGIGGPAMRQQVSASLNRVHRFPGFPIQRVRAAAAGAPDAGETETLKKLERKALPASLFTVPPGFTREDPMNPARGPRRGPPGKPQ